MGLGVRPVPLTRLRRQDLLGAFSAFEQPEMKEKAAAMREEIAREAGAENAVRHFHACASLPRLLYWIHVVFVGVIGSMRCFFYLCTAFTKHSEPCIATACFYSWTGLHSYRSQSIVHECC